MSTVGDNIKLVKEMYIKENITDGDAIMSIMNTLIALDDRLDALETPADLLQKGAFVNWKELFNSGPIVVVPDPVDAGLKLWLCTTANSKTYFAHALNEDQARTMVEEILGEGTVVNVFNFNNEFQVMTEL